MNQYLEMSCRGLNMGNPLHAKRRLGYEKIQGIWYMEQAETCLLVHSSTCPLVYLFTNKENLKSEINE
jgi:hypothetical protein